MTISEAYNAYRTEYIVLKNLSSCTEDNYRQALRSAARTWGDMQIEDLTFNHIKQWNDDMVKICGASTRRNYLSKMKHLLRYTNKKGITQFDLDDIIYPKEPKRIPKYLLAQEVKSLIEAAGNDRDRAIISLLFSTAIRVTELTKIDRTDLSYGTIIIQGKGNKERSVLVDPITQERIEKYLASRTDRLQPLFLTTRNTRLQKETVERIVRTAGIVAGMKKQVTPHMLRHSHATDLLSNGADIRYIQHSLGHEHISTTMIYTHIIDNDFAKVYQRYHTCV